MTRTPFIACGAISGRVPRVVLKLGITECLAYISIDVFERLQLGMMLRGTKGTACLIPNLVVYINSARLLPISLCCSELAFFM